MIDCLLFSNSLLSIFCSSLGQSCTSSVGYLFSHISQVFLLVECQHTHTHITAGSDSEYLLPEYLSCRFIRNAIAAVASYPYGFHCHILYISPILAISRTSAFSQLPVARRGMWRVACGMWHGEHC